MDSVDSVAGKFEWDFMYAPKWAKTGKRFVGHNDQPNVITTAAQKHNTVEESALFSAFLSGDHVQGLVAKTGTVMPVFKKVADSDDFLPAGRFKRKILMDGFNYRRGNQGFDWWYTWYRAMEPEFAKAMNGDVTPREALMAATRAGDAAISAQSLQLPSS